MNGPRYEDFNEGDIINGDGHLVVGIATGAGIGGPVGDTEHVPMNTVVALVYIAGTDDPIQLIMPGNSAEIVGQALIDAAKELNQ